MRFVLGQADLDGLDQIELDVDATVLHLDSEGKEQAAATLRLWDHDGLRRQVTLTNDPDGDPVSLELHHRSHAQVENRIKNLKDTGLSRLPFSSWTGNRVWFEIVLLAALLLAALQTLTGDPEMSVAEPRRLRYALLAIAARVVHRHRQVHVRLDVLPAAIVC